MKFCLIDIGKSDLMLFSHPANCLPHGRLLFDPTIISWALTGCCHCGITDSLGAIVRTHQGGRPTFLIREPHYAFDVFSSVMVSFCSARQRSMQTDLIFLKEYAAQHYKCLNPYKSLIHFYSSNIPFKMERQLGEKGKKNVPYGSTDLECCF